jgi:hypothetical protein
MAGFGFSKLSEWFPWDLGRQIGRLVTSQQQVERRRAEVLSTIRRTREQSGGEADIKTLRRIERQVSRANPCTETLDSLEPGLTDWNSAHREWRDAQVDLLHALEGQDAVVASASETGAAGRPFRSAVFTNSPTAHQALSSPQVLDTARRRLIASYAQSFTGKCETTSVAGPTNRLRIGTGTMDEVFVRPGDQSEFRSLLSYWAAMECLRAVLARNPMCVKPRSRAEPDPEAPEASLLASCDGARSVSEIAALHAVRPSELDARLRVARDAGHVSLEPWLSPYVNDPGAALLAEVELTSDDEAIGMVTELLHHVGRLTSGHSLADRKEALDRAEALFTKLTGHRARRSGGQFYSDRFIYAEEAYGNGSGLEIGRTDVDSILERLGGALDLVASEALEVRETQIAARCNRADAQLAVRDRRAVVLRQLLEQRASVTGGHVYLSSSELIEAGLIRSELDAEPLLGSADLMIGILPDSEPMIVLSEVHHILPPISLPLAPLAGVPPEEGRTLIEELLEVASLSDLAVPLANRPHKAMDVVPRGLKQLNLDWTTPTIEGAVACTTSDVLSDPDLRIYPLYDEHHVDEEGLYERFVPALDKAPLLRGDRFSPRVYVDGVVVERASWGLHHEDFERQHRRRRTLGESLLAVTRARAKHGFPRWIYVRFGSLDSKPMLIDCEIPELCDVLMRKLSSPDSPGEVHVSEMLPTPDQLWLQSEQGGHCAELRLCLARERMATKVES